MIESLYSEPCFIDSGRKYILKDSCGLMIGLTKFPETLVTPEDDYNIDNGVGYGIRVHFVDIDDDLVVCLDDEQMKQVVKGMKRLRKEYKRRRRRWLKRY